MGAHTSFFVAELDWERVMPGTEAEMIKGRLRAQPELLHSDPELLADLGLRVDSANIVDFGPKALAKAKAAGSAEADARRELESLAKANFTAQAHTHGAVLDLLEARNPSDLGRRMDELSTLRFGLVGAVTALEEPGRVPAGWTVLQPGGVDALMNGGRLARLGQLKSAFPLFGDRAPVVRSVALARIGPWTPQRSGLIAFGSPDPDGFTPQMGSELVGFLARVAERLVERWQIL
jgi:uncharacterized protein YigA (DUF484 family)